MSIKTITEYSNGAIKIENESKTYMSITYNTGDKIWFKCEDGINKVIAGVTHDDIFYFMDSHELIYLQDKL